MDTDREVQEADRFSTDREGALVSNDLFDFLVYLRRNTDTFDKVYAGEPFSADLARSIVAGYTGETTDLPTLAD
jgi:hypothetical protein